MQLRTKNKDRYADRVKTIMLRWFIYVFIPFSLLLIPSCGTKKGAVSPQPAAVSEPAWHTCLIQNARATVTLNEQQLSANVTMQTVRDSMIVISVMPMLGMEMMRIEATPIEITAIDKLHGQYAKSTYADINRQLTPNLNWNELQQLCTAELPTGEQRARYAYIFGEQIIELVIAYPARKLDVPVRMQQMRLDKYTRIDVSKWL